MSFIIMMIIIGGKLSEVFRRIDGNDRWRVVGEEEEAAIPIRIVVN